MKICKANILCIAFALHTLLGFSQTVKQFNGQFNISTIKSLGEGQYQIAGAFSDQSNTFTASQAAVNDQIIDKNSNAYKIISITSVSGSTINTVCLALNSGTPIAPGIGVGIIFRPSANGYPLITTNTPSSVLTTTLNTSTVSINSDLPSFSSGGTLPDLSWKIGDAAVFSSDSKPYALTANGWILLTGITTKYGATIDAVPISPAGTVILFNTDRKYYISDGTVWSQLPTLSVLPSVPKFGDVYYETGQKKLFMLADGGADGDGIQWIAISSAGIPGGGTIDFPTSPHPGDLFFNTDNNTLYLYDTTNSWVEVSTNGSTPADLTNPDPSSGTIKEGRLFYNTSEHQLYVYTGTYWMPVGNFLGNGQIFVGNSSNVASPVFMTGDAVITNTGKLTINDQAVTDAKLDKANIPLSGFGNPTANVSMGDGSVNYRIINLQTPAYPQEAATKGYVDNLFGSPATYLALPSGNFFIGNALNKASAVAKSTIPLSGFGNPTANISMNGKLITNLGSPSNPSDAVNKDYVDTRPVYPINISLFRNMLLQGNDQDQAGMVEKKDIPVSDFGTATADISLGGFKISGLANPVAATDAANKSYVDAKVIDPANLSLTSGNFFVGNSSNRAEVTLKGSIPLSGFGAATADISLGNSKIVNLAVPIADNDAANKRYVDDLFKTPSNLLALPAGNFFVGNSYGKAEPTLKSAVPVSGFGKAGDNIYMGDASHQYNISYLAEPLGAQDAATKNYVDSKVANPSSINLPEGSILVGNAANQAEAVLKSNVSISDFGTVNSNLSLGNYKITNLGDPLNDGDAVNKKYLTTQLSAAAGNLTLPQGQLFVGNASNKAAPAAKTSIPISDFGAAGADLLLGNHKITGLADPTADQEAATKKYVDSKGGSVPSGPTPPSSPSAGDTYYNTTEKTFYVYDGSQWVPVDNKLPTGQLYVGDANNKAAPTAKTSIPLSGFGAAADDINLGAYKITNLADPTADQEAATKKYVDSKSGSVPSGPTPPSSPSAGDTYYNTTDKTFYVYDGSQWVPVDNKLPTGQLYVGDANNKAAPIAKTAIPLSDFGAAAANIDLGSHKITNLTDPTADQEAATKKYVDSKAGSNPSGPTPPSDPSAGDTYYNTTTKKFYVFDGTQWVPVDNGSTLPEGQLFVGDATNKAAATAKSDISLTGFGAPTEDISMGSKRVLDVATPILLTDAANKNYVDVLVSTVGGNYLTKPAYDADNNGKVDDADKVNGLTVETAVPQNAVFTDEKVKVGSTGTSKYLSTTDFDNSGTDITIKNLSLAKISPIDANSLIGNNTTSDATPVALSPDEVKAMLALNNVDNTRDASKNVYSATKLTIPITINGIPFDGSSSISVPGDNLGSHTATQNIKTLTYSISSDGQDGHGLSFENPGNAILGQDLTVKGNLYTPSDERLKTRIETLSGVLKAIDQMRGVRFEYKDQKKYAKGPKIGVIAQELEKVYPEMVTKGSDGFFKVDYTQLTAVLIEAVKEQQQKMNRQQQEIDELKAKLDRQQQQIDAILKKLN